MWNTTWCFPRRRKAGAWGRRRAFPNCPATTGRGYAPPAPPIQEIQNHVRYKAHQNLRHYAARRRAIAGCSMNLREKMEVAQALVELGVDIIEAGFPIASPGDFESVREISGVVRGATICGLARCNNADIDRAWEALKLAPQPRIHVFLATSAIHREFKLKMTREEIVERAVAGVKRGSATATMLSSRPKTPPAPSAISSARLSKRPSRRARQPSTSPTRSATPRRKITAA